MKNSIKTRPVRSAFYCVCRFELLTILFSFRPNYRRFVRFRLVRE